MKKVLIEAELFLRLASSPRRKCRRERYRAGPLGKVSQEQRNEDSWMLSFEVLLGFCFLGFFLLLLLLFVLLSSQADTQLAWVWVGPGGGRWGQGNRGVGRKPRFRKITEKLAIKNIRRVSKRQI